MQTQSSLEKIAAFSFTGNHIINFQLMRDLEKTQTTKPEYFFFISFVPGIQGENGRTYDIKTATSLKYLVYEIAALSFALKQYAQGNGKHINYIKFTKSNSGQKALILEEATKATPGKNGEQYMQRQVLLKVASGGNTRAISMSLEQAYAIGETLDILFKKACDLEFSRNANSATFVTNTKQQPTEFNQNIPLHNSQNQPSNGFNQNSNFGNQQFTEISGTPFDIEDDDNSKFLGGSFNNFNDNPFN